MRYAGVLLAIWLIIGAIAVAQRGYFTNSPQTCASAGTIALTVIAGPLNYAGLNPSVSRCNIPSRATNPHPVLIAQRRRPGSAHQAARD